MPYYYKPKKADKTNLSLYKKLFKPIALSLGAVLFFYFWMITVLPNINIVWDLFKTNKSAVTSEDKIPPAKPFLADVPETTNKDTIDIKGYAEVGSDVKLFINGRETQKTLSDNDGTFAFNNVPVNRTNMEVYVLAEDSNGNVSDPSDNKTITYDNTPPKIAITKPEDNSVNEISNVYKIIGRTDEKCTVKVGNEIAPALYDNSFFSYVSLNEGGNNFTIEATDKAGNTSKMDLYINYSKTD